MLRFIFTLLAAMLTASPATGRQYEALYPLRPFLARNNNAGRPEQMEYG